MSNTGMNRIKGTHVPRLILAVIALIVFFGTIWSKLVGRAIDYTRPGWALLMVGFLFSGVLTLVVSWVIGLETRAEIAITVMLLLLHVVFDGYIFINVFILNKDLPVALVQAVVQVYWMAGLFDVLSMYAGANWERTRPDFQSPEELLQQKVDNLKETLSVIKQERAQLEHANKMLEDGRAKLEARLSKKEAAIQRAQEEAERTYTLQCEYPECVWETTKASLASAERSLNAHKGIKHPDYEQILSKNGS